MLLAIGVPRGAGGGGVRGEGQVRVEPCQWGWVRVEMVGAPPELVGVIGPYRARDGGGLEPPGGASSVSESDESSESEG